MYRRHNNKLAFIASISFALLCLGGLYFYFQAQPAPINEESRKAGEQLALKGGNGAIPCVSCHGARGEGNFAAGFPRLAGLHKDYIAKQLRDFARDPLNTRPKIEPAARDYRRTPDLYEDLTVYSPGVRTDATMNSIARQLSAEDMQNLGLYYSLLSFAAKPEAIDYQTLQRGADLALRGKPEYRVPACIACHGPDGEGFGAHFPPLVGQPTQYLIQQINKWQSGQRDNDHLSLMKNVSNQLTDADKINAAAYFSNRSYRVNTR